MRRRSGGIKSCRRAVLVAAVVDVVFVGFIIFLLIDVIVFGDVIAFGSEIRSRFVFVFGLFVIGVQIIMCGFCCVGARAVL